MILRRKTKSRDQAEMEVRSLGWWYQYFELPSGVWTGDGQAPSYQPETRWRLIEPHVPKDLSGQTVLDAGGNAGYFSVQMKLRGAKRCVLVEPVEEFALQARYVAREFQVKLEIVKEDIHTYCLTTEDRFDYVFFLGIFYHLKYPVLVLDRLAEMTKRTMFFQSLLTGSQDQLPPQAADDPDCSEDTNIYHPAFPRMMFIEHLYNGDPTNWWIPNHTALESLIHSAGLRVIARPHPEVIVAEPEVYFGKVAYRKLIFPRYGKREGGPRFPGPQKVDPEQWRQVLLEASLKREQKKS